MTPRSLFILCVLAVFGLVFALSLFTVAARADDAMVRFQPRPPDPVDISSAVASIKAVEHWDGWSVGAAGEHGAMQFKPKTWRHYSRRPYHWAEGRTPLERVECSRVETEYVQDLIRYCQTLGISTSIYNLGLLHNAGFDNVRLGAIQRRHRDFAQQIGRAHV